jgi:hypothetical protein
VVPASALLAGTTPASATSTTSSRPSPSTSPAAGWSKEKPRRKLAALILGHHDLGYREGKEDPWRGRDVLGRLDGFGGGWEKRPVQDAPYDNSSVGRRSTVVVKAIQALQLKFGPGN